MRAVRYSQHGTSDVLQLVERPIPTPEADEVRVKIFVSGVNPTDWKSRSGTRPLESSEVTPHHDGAGIIDAVGDSVKKFRVGDRVWINMARHEIPNGTAQEYTVLKEYKVAPLPDEVSYAVGASLGVPAMTAHRALTLHERGPKRLTRNALKGRTVLVQGGAGAVGNATIQLATWAGATVISTVSSAFKAELARAAGSHHVLQYPDEQLADKILELAPDGVDHIVEVSPAQNASLDVAVIANQGSIASYGSDKGSTMTLEVSPFLRTNASWQGVLLYTLDQRYLDAAMEDITAALRDNAIGVGPEAGLPLTWFSLEETAAAHDAVENGTIGKVLIALND